MKMLIWIKRENKKEENKKEGKKNKKHYVNTNQKYLNIFKSNHSK